MKKTDFKQINITDPIFRASLSVFIGNTDKIKEYLVGKCGFEDYGDVYDAKYVPNSKNQRAIILNTVDTPTIAHEIIHYCFDVFKSRNIPIEYENDEVMAYYFEMTLKNILKELK